MITTINEFRNNLNPINEMSYASLQNEIDEYTQQLNQLKIDMEEELAEFAEAGTLESDEGAKRRDWYGSEMNKLERKIETRRKYIERLRSGRKSEPKHLTVGSTITYQGTQYIVLSIDINSDSAQIVKHTDEGIYSKGNPIRITNVEPNGKIFVNTWKDNGGGFNNFAKVISISDIDNVETKTISELTTTTRIPKEPKVKVDRERINSIKQIVRILTKNIDSVKPSIDKFKDRTAEEQATIFKKRFNIPFDVELIIAALQQMGLVITTESETVTENVSSTYQQIIDKITNAFKGTNRLKKVLNVISKGKWDVIECELEMNGEHIVLSNITSALEKEFQRYDAAIKKLHNNVFKVRLYSPRAMDLYSNISMK